MSSKPLIDKSFFFAMKPTPSTESSTQPAPVSPNCHIQPLNYNVRGNEAFLGDLSLTQLAKTFGTPLYVLDGATVEGAAKAYTSTLTSYYPGKHLVCYASKANINVGLAQKLGKLGLGLDIVSGGELATAMAAGFPPENICFNGNNKSDDELLMALHHRIGRITVDNLDELGQLANLARKEGYGSDADNGRTVQILVRIAPGIECHTHEYIQTGQEDTKFGVGLKELPKLFSLVTDDYADVIELCGLHAHIGSQIFEGKPYADAAKLVLNIYANVRQKFGLTLRDLNIGGGLGIAYTEADDPLAIPATMATIASYIADYAQSIDYPLPRLLLEPGRSLIANAGITLYTIGAGKIIPANNEIRNPFRGRHYIAVDGGMGDNIRPALYGAAYSSAVVNKASHARTQNYRVVGKYCESGDVLLPDVKLPPLERGDILAVFGTGAYNASMANTYNRVPRPAMIWVEHDQVTTLVRRETYDDLLRLDVY